MMDFKITTSMWNDGPPLEGFLLSEGAPSVAQRHICSGGGKGGAAPAPANSTVTQNTSSIPDYASGYFTNMLDQASSLQQAPYQPYTGNRIADLNTNQTNAINSIASNQGSYQPYYNQAGQGLASALNTAQNTSFDPAQAQNTYGASNFNPQDFTGANVQKYMDPYLQQSLDPQIALLNRQFGQQGNKLNSQAAGNGAFGGYRAGIEQSENNLNNNLAFSNLVGQGYNNAFNNAQGQFNTSQQQQMAANQLNNQYGQAQSSLGMQATNQNNQSGLAAAQLQMQGGQQATQAALGLQGLGTAQQAAGQSDANALLSAGTVQQNQSQNALNQQYNDFLSQQYYPYQTLNWMSGILRGVPVTANQTQTSTSSPPSPVSQIAGLGLSGLGLAKALG